MKRKSMAFLLSVAGLTVFAVVGLAESAEVRQPSGTIQVATKSIGVGVGVTWGKGTLSFKGADYAFAVEGMTFTDLGIGEETVKGNIYNLNNLQDFAGRYTAAEPSFELGGPGPPWSRSYTGMILSNEKGVVAQIWAVREGPRLRLMNNAVEVKLK